MEIARTSTVTIDDPSLRYRVCFAFDVLGVFMCLLLLGLSAVRRGSQWNAGPRIFTVNLMLVNLLHAGCGACVHGGFAFEWMKPALGLIYWKLYASSFAIQSGTLLAFNCSFVPMMVVSIMSVRRPLYMSQKKRFVLYFTVSVLIADAIPLVFQVTNVLAMHNVANSTLQYTIVLYILYFVQVTLTIVAIIVIARKNAAFAKTQAADTSTSKASLVRLLMFSVAPCVLQVPFAIQQVVRLLRLRDG
ncbi:hypothetical protein AAVH_22951 [Aphelenchoides avenae]|nr:hypothetical protein AAVH_22951 [Aphelenchus avenae]